MVETSDNNSPAIEADEQPLALQKSSSDSTVAKDDFSLSVDEKSRRIPIQNARLSGSIRLTGARIDDLFLTDYKTNLSAQADNVTLLKPGIGYGAYYADFGWAPGATLKSSDVPGTKTQWKSEDNARLSPSSPVTLVWESPAGLVFRREISLDENYMFLVRDYVENKGQEEVSLAYYGQISRHGIPADAKRFFILHEGAILQSGDEISEVKYTKFKKLDADPLWGANAQVNNSAGNGWVGITDHYWMTNLIPENIAAHHAVLKYDARNDIFRTIARLETQTIEAGQVLTNQMRFFAGAKEWKTMQHYERDLSVYRFVDAIDWGWFFFLTKPIFQLLHWLNLQIGNMGWAIIGLTLVIKIILFPLAYKSYASMARMKELQPEMEKLKERCGDDRTRMQKEMMALYKSKKVNPAAGCLPLLLQIPIFFSLYKVIFVTIELRHAPWFGWIKDLSAPDPSSLLNLWGVLPWQSPEPGSVLALVFIGILPLILGVSMWLQQKLNPAPTDPTQAMILAWMPWVFMFMLGGFASGLVIYWIANNVITFIQQYVIMRRMGYKPDVFGNIVKSFVRKQRDVNASDTRSSSSANIVKDAPEAMPSSSEKADPKSVKNKNRNTKSADRKKGKSKPNAKGRK